MFKVFPQLSSFARSKSRVSRSTLRHFPGPGMAERLARALCEHEALTLKELVESFELFERVRRPLRGGVLTELMCGHGLVGALFAVFEKSQERVILTDARKPPSYDIILRAISRVAPWAPPKLEFRETRLEDASGDAFLAVHACGQRTDLCLDLAIARRTRIAVMPCCYGPPREASAALLPALGVALATDVARTYRLEQAGFRVKWTAIPEEITPMNRVLVATTATGQDTRPPAQRTAS